jgi:hypothetical protein
MKVTIDIQRVSHLAILLIASYAGGQFLAEQLDFSKLSAYGMSCYVVCQLGNIVLKLWEWNNNSSPSLSLQNAPETKSMTRTKEPTRKDSVQKSNRAKTKK